MLKIKISDGVYFANRSVQMARVVAALTRVDRTRPLADGERAVTP